MTKADGQKATDIVAEINPDTLFVKSKGLIGGRVGFPINTIISFEPAESTTE